MVEPVCRTYRALRTPDFLARPSFCQRSLAEWASCFHEHSRINGLTDAIGVSLLRPGQARTNFPVKTGPDSHDSGTLLLVVF